MSPKQAAELDRWLGTAKRLSLLTAGEFFVLNRMLWTLRSMGSPLVKATLDLIVARTGCCRDTVVRAIDKAITLEILVKTKTRVRRAIGAVVRVVNGTNIYRFVSKSAGQTTPLKASLDSPLTPCSDPPRPAGRALEDALARFAASLAGRSGNVIEV